MEDEWISLNETARRLGITAHTVYRVVPAAGIRKRVIPGTFTKFHAGDVERVRASAVQLDGRRKGVAG